MFFRVAPLLIALAVTLPGLAFMEYVANKLGYTYNILSTAKERTK